MKLESYWTDSAPNFQPAAHELPAQVDVAIVGAVFTGLSAARALARRGAKVAVLEAGDRVAGEALRPQRWPWAENGLTVDYAHVAAKVGVERAREWYRAYDEGVGHRRTPRARGRHRSRFHAAPANSNSPRGRRIFRRCGAPQSG